MKHALVQAAVILGTALLLAVLAVWLRPGGIDFLLQGRQRPPTADAATEARHISVREAFDLMKQGRAVLVDARSPEDFRLAHIDGALSLPETEKDAWLDRVMQQMPPDTPLIAYCSDARCHLAEDLAETLYLAGFEDVRVMQEGLEEWRKQGLPTAAGDAP